MTPTEPVVHLCDWASQPDIRIKCSQTMTTPKWRSSETSAELLSPGIYKANNGDLYTFDRGLVTCPECRA
jgi:hypothetical protein